jgi:hypothetical protein
VFDRVVKNPESGFLTIRNEYMSLSAITRREECKLAVDSYPLNIERQATIEFYQLDFIVF